MKKLRNEMKHSVFFLPILVIAMMFVPPVFGHEPGSVETEAEQSRVYMKIGIFLCWDTFLILFC